MYQVVADNKNILVSIDGAEDICITADINRMRQVVGNLLDNAIKFKYSGPGGRVMISLRTAANHAVISFRDTGIGLPAEIPEIWKRLYRGDKSRSQPGLGLV